MANTGSRLIESYVANYIQISTWSLNIRKNTWKNIKYVVKCNQIQVTHSSTNNPSTSKRQS
ncbi:hypothetical protein SESBI_38497 [Sesbania bispinosa]|nr:hypothetical protein SESBI_38497 [Sesbania bispinosa]